MATDDSKAPSEAWRRSVFDSAPRIDVEKTGNSSTRHPINVGWTGNLAYANGGHERTAMLILEHLWVLGLVRRWKSQPLNLQEVGGPNCVPDILVELQSRELQIVECKAKRFITPEVQAKFDRSRDFLPEVGIGFHVWTNRDFLSSDTSHTVAELERGRTYPPTAERLRQIAEAARSAHFLGDLTDKFGWDDALSAAAHIQFHFDFMRPIDEETPIQAHSSYNYSDRLFKGRNAHGSWWSQLTVVQPDSTESDSPGRADK